MPPEDGGGGGLTMDAMDLHRLPSPLKKNEDIDVSVPCREEISSDLERITELRTELVGHFSPTEQPSEDLPVFFGSTVLPKLHEYSILLGALLAIGVGATWSPGLKLPWRLVRSDAIFDGASKTETDVIWKNNSFQRERESVIYDIGAIEFYLATCELQKGMRAIPVKGKYIEVSPDVASGSKEAIKNAKEGFSTAAAVFFKCADHCTSKQGNEEGSEGVDKAHELSVTDVETKEENPLMLLLFHAISMSHGQACYYQAALLEQRHAALAKLAAGCSDLFDGAAVLAEKAINIDRRRTSYLNIHQILELDLLPSMAVLKSTYLARSKYFNSIAEYHESRVAEGRQHFVAEIARLRKSLADIEEAEHTLLGGNIPYDFDGGDRMSALTFIQGRLDQHLSSSDFEILDESLRMIVSQRSRCTDLLVMAEERVGESTGEEGIEIPRSIGSIMMKDSLKVSDNAVQDFRELMPSTILKNLLDDDGIETCKDFQRELGDILSKARLDAANIAKLVEETISRLDLPHSLINFKASMQGEIPLTTKNRIEVLHRDQEVVLLKQELYMFSELADQSREDLHIVKQMVDDTYQEDSVFRNKNPTFAGKTVEELYAAINFNELSGANEALELCEKWLKLAHEEDQKTRQEFEEFQSDPKFELIMSPLHSLEQLLLTEDWESKQAPMLIDTSDLEQALAGINALVDDRKSSVTALEESASTFRLRPLLVSAKMELEKLYPDQPLADGDKGDAYEAVVARSFALFYDQIDSIEPSTQSITAMLQNLANLNAKFSNDCSISGNSKRVPVYVEKIVLALDALDSIKKRVVAGSNFYQECSSHINILKKRVSDANALLALERINFEDKLRNTDINEGRRQQEEEDERIAQKLANEAVDGISDEQRSILNEERRRQEKDDERIAQALANETINGNSAEDQRSILLQMGQLEQDQKMAAELALQYSSEARISDSGVGTEANGVAAQPPPSQIAGEDVNEQGDDNQNCYSVHRNSLPTEILADDATASISLDQLSSATRGRYQQETHSRARSASQAGDSTSTRRNSRPGIYQVRNDDPSTFGQVDDQAVAQLVSMGFVTQDINDALVRFDNNVELAAEYIVSRMT